MTVHRRRQLAALVAWGTTVTALRAQEAPRSLEPDWTWQTEAGIEWAEPVGPAETPAILVATPAGHLHLIDLATGKPRLPKPIVAGRGVRPAGHPVEEQTAPGKLACCFDRHAAYAIRLSEPAGLAWRYGEPPAEGDEFRGDPETLSGWSLAETTTAGLLLVNLDGRVVLLSHADGRPRWEINLGPLPVARLHVRGGIAVVLWKSQDDVQAGFLNLGPLRPSPIQRDLGRDWPIWSTLVPEGLLAVSNSHVAIWPAAGGSRQFDLPGRVSATGVDVRVPRRANENSSAPETVLLVAFGSDIAAYSVATGQSLWRVLAHCDMSASGATLVVEVSVAGRGRVIAASNAGIEVRDAVSARLILSADFARPYPDQPRAWRLADQWLYVLDRLRDEPGAPLQLARYGAWEYGRVGSSREMMRPATCTAQLAPAGDIRQVRWVDRFLILLGRHNVRAYSLPSWNAEDQ